MRKAEYLYSLLKESGIINAKGQIYFELQELKTTIKDSSVVGNITQEWLQAFMNKHNLPFRTKQNSQEFPDFLMNPSNDQVDLLEVKCFKKSPNFDIANFQAYSRSLLHNAYRLDSDYLIFEYTEETDGINIKNMWLKKVWEICCPSERSPLKIQWKQEIPVNIRPATWYSTRVAYQPFSSRKDFILAIKKVLDTSSVSQGIQKNWAKKYQSNIKVKLAMNFSGVKYIIP